MGEAKSIVKITAETNQYEQKIRQAQKTFNNFTKSLGLNLGKFTAVGAALGAVTTAVKVAGDAFKNNEQIVDEWGRVTKSAQSIYDGFLNSLNTGSISGYIRNINDIVNAARAAYDALDELGTFNAFNQINEMKARTGFSDAITAFREGTGSRESVKSAAESLKDQLAERQGYEQAAYDKAIADYAAKRNVNEDMLRKALGGTYGDYKTLKELPLTGVENKYQAGGMFGQGVGYSYQVKVAANEAEALGEMLRKLNDKKLGELQALGKTAESTAYEISQVDRQLVRALGQKRVNGGSVGGATGATGVQKGLTPEQYGEWFGIAYYTALSNTINSELKDAPIIQESLISDEDLAIEEKFADSIETLAERTERLHETWDLVAGSISTVGGALAGLEDPTARIIGTVMQAVATLAVAYAEASAKAAKLGPVAWLGFAATGLATFVGAASTIKNTTKGGFAEGGIVPGNYYGDQLSTANYGISSGELILNKAQQNAIAGQLRQAGGMELTATISGEQIRFVLNRNGRRTGRGEYVTTNFS